MAVSKATGTTLTVLALSIALAIWLRNGAQGDAAADSAPALALVRVVTISPRAVGGEINVGGFLRARADITISAERAGRVVALPIAEGGAVGADQVVARLDDTLAAANLTQAAAAAREAGLDPNVPAAELARAVASLQRARHEHALHNPVALIAGTVEQHHVDVGEYVKPGAPLVDVIDASRLILDVDVDAEIIALLKASKVTVAGREATIVRRAGRADSVTRRFRVELEVEPKDLRPGMYATATFLLPPSETAFFLPKSSVRVNHGETGAFVVRDGKAVWVPVVTAAVHHQPQLWRVSDGALRAGDKLVTAGFSGLRDGAAVQEQK